MKTSKNIKELIRTLVILACFSFLTNQTLQAQHTACGIHHEIEEYKKSNPEEYSIKLSKYNKFINESVIKAKELKNDGNDDICPNGVTIIPIAFQVFHDGEAVGTGYNFSIDDLRLIVDQLNTDYSGYTGLKDRITTDFADFEAGHTCIQFAIGKVNRINTRQCSYYKVGATHSTLHNCLPGGSGVGSANDPNDYLNIYITDLKSGYLGIASSIPPLYGKANSDDDGVSINRDIVIPGKNPNSLYNRGSVLSHEVGHWLGLPHVNGDINGSGCDADDGFSDTYPQSAQRFYYCNNQEIPQSCGSVDNIFNFMDYSADCAKLMFTEEQAITMQRVLGKERKGLSSSFARGKEDRSLFNTTCKAFEANASLFEFLVLDCHGEINFLDYQTKWYPSSYNTSNPTGGLTVFTWMMENKGEVAQSINKSQLAKSAVSHNATGYTDINVYNLYVQCWDPYKKSYSDKQPAGKLMLIMKRCATPDNDLMANAEMINFGSDCSQASYLINNSTASRSSEVSCSPYQNVKDVWFKTIVPEQSGMTVQANRADSKMTDPLIEVFVMRNGKLACVNQEVASLIEMTDLIPGEEVYFRVFNTDDSQNGAFTMCLMQSALNNNTCATAATLSVGSTCDSKIYHNFGATASAYPSNKALCGRSDRARDVWFKAVVPASGNLFVESFQIDGGVSEVIMEAYSGSCGNLQAVACSSIKEYWPVYDRHALIELENRRAGEVIYIRIFGEGTIEEGEFGLCAYGGEPQTSCRINYIESIAQGQCKGSTNTYDQTIRVHYRNSGANEYLYVNNKAYAVTGSPQVITIKDLTADGKQVNITANIGNSADDLCWQQSFYKAYGLFTAPQNCLSVGLANDDCVGAIELTAGSSCNRETFSSLGATYSVGSSSYFSCGVSGYRPNDVWFKVRVPANGNLTVSAPLLFNENNMIMEAYAGACDALVLIDCDQFGGSMGSEIKLTDQQPGEMIYFRVADQGNNTQGDFAMCAFSPSTNGFNTEATESYEPEVAWRYDEETETIIVLDNEAQEEVATIEEVIGEGMTIKAYPNPTTDYINVELNQATITDATYTLYDLSGKRVRVVNNTTEKKVNMNVSDLNTGQYYLNVTSAEGSQTEIIQILR